MAEKSEAYNMFDGEQKVGEADVTVLAAFEPSKYPGCPEAWKGKSVLEIEGFGIFGIDGGGHGRGYGRAGLQECYKLAQEVSDGRMVVHATWGAGPFYEHCGFKGEQAGKEGIKYFEPTEEALGALFPKGRGVHARLSLQKKPPEDFQFDFEGIQLDDIGVAPEATPKKGISARLDGEKTPTKTSRNFPNRGGNDGM